MKGKQLSEQLEYIKQRITVKELQQELEWRRCADSCQHFLENYWSIRDKAKPRLKKFELWPYQKEALDAFAEHKQLLVLKARQIGFTTLTSAYFAWRALFQEHQKLFVVSRTQSAAQTVLQDLHEVGLKSLPPWLWEHDRTPRIGKATQSKIEFSNGSSIESFATRGSPARGRTSTVMWLDEWAYFERPDKAWASAFHTIEGDEAQMIATSTARKSGSLFHNQWEAAKQGKSGFTPKFFSWRVVPGRDEEWYASKKAAAVDDKEMHREHPSDPDEAFLRSGATVFDMGAVRSSPVIRGDRGRCVGDVGSNISFKKEVGGPLEVFERPQQGDKYALGVDVSLGISGGDYACVVVLNCFSGDQAAIWHGLIDPDDLATVVNRLGLWYNMGFVGVEANGAGIAVLRALKDMGYPAIYRRLTVDRAVRSTLTQLGWLTTKMTKPMMTAEANADLKTNAVTIRSVDLARELAGFVYIGDSDKMGGTPDDRVIAFCIANQMRRHWLVSPEETEPEMPEMSMPWLKEVSKRKKESNKRLAILRSRMNGAQEHRHIGDLLRR